MICMEHLLLLLQLGTLLAETACFCFSLSSLISVNLVWFWICTCILCVTSVVTQFLSLSWTQADISRCKYGLLVLLHMIFLGLPIRYVIAGIRGLKNPQLYATVFKHTGLLRLVYTSLCTVPLTICFFYVFWFSGRIHWIYFATSIVGVLSGATSLCVLRRPSVRVTVQKDKVNCSAIILSFIWRFGELVSRTLVLVLFASLYYYWVLLVIGLHWFTMFAWASIFSYARGQHCSPSHLLHICSVSYINTFAFLDSTKFQPKYGRLLYYLIMSVENATLVIVCLIYTWEQTLNVLIAMVATGAFVASLIAAGIHRLCIKPDILKPEETVSTPTAEPSQSTNKTIQPNGFIQKNTTQKRPIHPPNYSDINNSSVTTSMETLDTQLTKSSCAHKGYPVLIGEAPPGVPLAASHFHSVSNPDLSLKRKRGCTRSVSQVDKNDVIRLIMRESGSTAIGDSDPNISTLSHTRRPNGRFVRPASKVTGNSHHKVVISPLSESESEYAWDHYDFLYSPEDIVQLDPRLLDAPIVFYKKPKLNNTKSPEAPTSGQDSDYGTLNQWVDHTKQVSRTNRTRRESNKKKPSIVCGTGFHKQRQGILYANDALAWRRSESDISKTSKTTALSAPSEFMIINSPHDGRNSDKMTEAMSVISSQTHHSDPISYAGIHHIAPRPPVLSPRSSQTHGDVTSESCMSGPIYSSQDQDDACSIYSTDISSHTTADELKAAISEKYRIKTRSAKRNPARRKSDKTPDSIRESVERTPKLSKKKQFEAEIDSIVSAIKTQNIPQGLEEDSASFHVCQKSYTSDYGSLQEPEISLRTWYNSQETET